MTAIPPPPTKLPSSLVVDVHHYTLSAQKKTPTLVPATPAAVVVVVGAPVVVAPAVVVVSKRRLAARRERTQLAVAANRHAMLLAEATRGPSPTPAPCDIDDCSTVVGGVRTCTKTPGDEWGCSRCCFQQSPSRFL